MLRPEKVTALAEAAAMKGRVRGLTHNFYRYPARFSPAFAARAIQLFSRPGDVVLDPFMGGGTTIVEALASGRRAVGTDLNPLAVSIAKVKTTELEVIQPYQSTLALLALFRWLSTAFRTLRSMSNG